MKGFSVQFEIENAGEFEELWASHLLRIKEDAEAKATGAHVAEEQTKKRPKMG